MRRLLLKLFRRRRLERDLAEEMAFHREMAAAGGNPIPFGNPAVLAEEARDLWRFAFLENLWRDVRLGARGLVRRPGLAASAVLSLALGIGANATIFALAVELLFSEPSVRDASSLVYVRLGGNSHADHQVLETIDRTGVLTDLAGENEETFINWNSGSETRRLFSVVTTKNFFSSLGVPLAQGRGYMPPDPDDVVVLSDRFWRVHLNANPTVVGRPIILDGRAYVVVGILPASHRTLIGYGYSPDVYVPRFLDRTVLAMYAHLQPGMSIEQATTALRSVGARLDVEMPHEYLKFAAVNLSPIAGYARLRQQSEAMVVGVFFIALLAVVTLVLLIACVNVAGLLLAQASVRRREMAIRQALGASPGRLLQQMLVESFLLSLAGAGVGLVIAQWTAGRLSQLSLPIPIPLHLRIDPDWRVLSYAVGLTMLSTLVSGFLPAWRSVSDVLAPDLHRERKLYLRRALLVAQIAVSVVVLTTAGLFVRNLFEANAISPGFEVRQTLRATANLPPAAYRDAASIRRYVNEALNRLGAVPGLDGVAAASVLPFHDSVRNGFKVTFLDTGEEKQVSTQWNAVTPEFFRVMSIPVRQGRPFTAADDGTSRVLIVNRRFVDQYLGGRNPVGVVMTGVAPNVTPYEIVGVVEGTKNVTIGEDDRPQLYEPFAQSRSDRRPTYFVLRSTVPPAAELKVVATTLREVDPAAGLDVATMSSSIGLAFLPSQVGAALMSAVGGLGLLLVAIGLSGTMAYSVSRRSREIGLRIALGATRSSVLQMVLTDSVWLLAIGIGVGLGAAVFVTKPLAAFLVPGLAPTDPLSFATVVFVMVATGLVATWAPARRAAAVDPMVTLRDE